MRHPRGNYQQLHIPRLLKTLRGGATLALGSIDKAHAPIRRLRRRLERDLGTVVATNLYASWGTTHGFKIHWDDHDVIALQVHGRKRWGLHEPTLSWPVKELATAPPQPAAPTREVITEAGSALYLPRGWWHDVAALNEPSIHLTFAILRPRGDDFLHWTVKRALSHVEIRQDLSELANSETIEAQVNRMREIVTGLITTESVHAYLHEQGEASPADPQPTLQTLEKNIPLNEWAASRHFMMLAPRAAVEVTDEAVLLRTGGQTWKLPRGSAPMVRRLASGEPIAMEILLEKISEKFLDQMLCEGCAAVV
ncbi:JmjC domain-containing protein [Streptomyces xiamenensis]